MHDSADPTVRPEELSQRPEQASQEQGAEALHLPPGSPLSSPSGGAASQEASQQPLQSGLTAAEIIHQTQKQVACCFTNSIAQVCLSNRQLAWLAEAAMP